MGLGLCKGTESAEQFGAGGRVPAHGTASSLSITPGEPGAEKFHEE